MSIDNSLPIRETLKEAGYTYVMSLGDGQHLLRDEDGKLEIWFANKNHASYGLLWRNTHLEFARNYDAYGEQYG